MRFLSVAAFALLSTTPAFAAVTGEQWQSQLQAEIQRLSAANPDIRAEGAVAVQEVNGQLRATLPALHVTSPDKSSWQIPPIILLGSASSEAVQITLPASITRMNASGTPIATMKLGAQALNGSWSYAGNYFTALNGHVGMVSFTDNVAKSTTQVAGIDLNAASNTALQFVATDIRNSTVTAGQKPVTSAIKKMSIAYQLPEINKLTITRLIGLFNPALLLTEGQKLGITVTAEQVSATDAGGRTTSAEKIVSAWQLQPKGTIIAASTNTQAFILRQNPPSAYAFVLPQKLELVANIANLPREMVSFAPGMSFAMAKEGLAKAGTTITISQLKATTFDQAVLSGQGSVKANSTVPSGFVGRMTVKIEKMKQIISMMQMQLLQPDTSANRSAKTQNLMAMMLLQGMGRQNGEDTEFVLDLTAEGQSLVNGQDIGPLLSGAKGGNPAAVPVTPVTGSDL